MSAVCLESVWERKASCTEHAHALVGPTNKFYSSTMWYITSVIINIVAAISTSILQSHGFIMTYEYIV